MTGSIFSDDASVPDPRRFPRRGHIFLAAAILAMLGGGAVWYLSAWRNLFFYGIKAEKLGLVRVMLQMGADPNRALKFDTPLTTTIHDLEHPLPMARLLLDFHADPNLPGASGRRPLQSIRHWKDDKCCVENSDAALIVDALLRAGADIRACGDDRSLLETPSSIEFAKLLLSRGADPNQVCSSHCGENSLRSLLEYPELVELYLERGAKILPDPCSNSTLLHRVASLEGSKNEPHPKRLRSAEILLAHGADVNAVDNSGKTALDYAYEKGNKDIAALLLKHGAKSLKFKNMEDGEESHAAKDEYEDLLMFSDNEGKGPRCSLSVTGEKRNTMEEGSEWSIIKGTVGLVRVNCHASGYFHYAVLGMGPPVPKKLNMSLGGGPGAARIPFNEKWSRGIMHWYYSEAPVTNLAKAVKQGKATQFAVRYVTVGD